MKKIMILSFCLMLLGFSTSNAQSVFNKGSIKLELTDIKSDNQDIAPFLDMMKGMSMETFFNEEHTLTKMDMMGGMATTSTLVNNKTKDMVMLFDMMGQKIKVVGNTAEEQEKLTKKEKDDLSKVKVNKIKSETKMIAGYKCYKIDIIMENSKDMKLSGFVTEEITAPANAIQAFQNVKMVGFPLEFTMEVGGMMTMTYTATEIKKELDHSIFKLNTDGYKEMSMKEFQENMGGMSGGLGF